MVFVVRRRRYKAINTVKGLLHVVIKVYGSGSSSNRNKWRIIGIYVSKEVSFWFIMLFNIEIRGFQLLFYINRYELMVFYCL